MNVSPINNTNFKGHFQRTPALEKILKNADRNSLGRFNDVIQRASKVNDGYLFRFYEFTPYNSNTTYNLHRKNTRESWDTIIKSVSTKINNSFGNGVNEAEILEKFLPTLEDIYPKKYITPKENLIEEITKNLV